MRSFICYLFLFISSLSFSQDVFDLDLLKKPKSYGPHLEETLPIKELPFVKVKKSSNAVFIPNKLRSSKYRETEQWTSLMDSVEAVGVDIIFSKYPIRRDGYKMRYKLLTRRIQNLLEIDPSLNEDNVKWRIVLQTHCENDEQVNSLFHGVRIRYKSIEQVVIEEVAQDTICDCEKVVSLKTQDSIFTQVGQYSKEASVLKMDKLDDVAPLPDEIRKKLEKMSVFQREEAVRDFYQSSYDSMPAVSFKGSNPKEKKKVSKKVKSFTKNFNTTDEVIEKVMNRHPEWKNALVVCDWTGSMYPYGGKILEWHVENFKKSGIQSFTLFNDGDHKMIKKIGKTGGVYHEEADNVDKLLSLYNLVMMRGGGGDGPENDVEGVIEAQLYHEEHDMIILIADNNACVRDLNLFDRIDKPVKVILCGYNPGYGVNPDYVVLAAKTGGSVHTIEEDIEDLKEVVVGTKVKGKLPLKVMKRGCGGMLRRSIGVSPYDNVVFTDLDSVKRIKRKVKKMKLKDKGFYEVPKTIYRLKYVKELDLSNNHLTEVNKRIKRIHFLTSLNLSNNQISKISEKIETIRYLKVLDLSNNELRKLNHGVFTLRKLEELNLSNNKLYSLKGRITWRKMKLLNLENNNLSSLPKSFARMSKLNSLNLSGNKFSEIPKEVYRLRKLVLLDLSENKIQKIPEWLYRMKRLKQLDLSGNSIPQSEIEALRLKLPDTRIVFDK